MRKLKAYIRIVLGKRWLSNRVLLFKSVLYQGFSVMMTFVMSMVLTQDIHISVGISLFDIIFKTMLYFIFEIHWNNLIKRM